MMSEHELPQDVPYEIPVDYVHSLIRWTLEPSWSAQMSFDWIYDGVDMSIRDYFATAIARQEPGVTFDDCVHDFSGYELKEIVNASDVTAFRSKDDSWIYQRQVWSPTRVYFICQDGTQQVQSRPRNPPGHD